MVFINTGRGLYDMQKPLISIIVGMYKGEKITRAERHK
jgi:hypothetical protein